MSDIGEQQTYSENGWSVSYRKCGTDIIYIRASKTVSSIGANHDQLEMIGLPFRVAFNQSLSMTESVSGTPVGYGDCNFNPRNDNEELSAMYRNNTEYGAPVTMTTYGLLIVE